MSGKRWTERKIYGVEIWCSWDVEDPPRMKYLFSNLEDAEKWLEMCIEDSIDETGQPKDDGRVVELTLFDIRKD